MDLGLAGKVVWVVGATGAIGKAISASFASEGARLALTSRRADAVAEAAQIIRDSGAEALEAPADARSADETRAAAKLIAETYGRLDVLVTSITVPAFGPFLEISTDVFQQAIDAKLFGAVNCIQAAIPLMREGASDGGSIVCVTGTGGKMPIGIHLPGGSVNAGLNLVVRGLATQFGPEGIRVNAVSPGPVRSPRQDIMQAAGASRDSPAASIPMRRFGELDEVADAVLFMASARSSYITGNILQVDGGGVLTT